MLSTERTTHLDDMASLSAVLRQRVHMLLWNYIHAHEIIGQVYADRPKVVPI
jgi:hypothetical protein